MACFGDAVMSALCWFIPWITFQQRIGSTSSFIKTQKTFHQAPGEQLLSENKNKSRSSGASSQTKVALL